mmetsp:Transcript_27259/g.58204  ORF Transcript_27259/g.58204 Transcript_27259/m.58204 type:complete len:233 (-) Transcript_27259:90-788(-)
MENNGRVKSRTTKPPLYPLFTCHLRKSSNSSLTLFFEPTSPARVIVSMIRGKLYVRYMCGANFVYFLFDSSSVTSAERRPESLAGISVESFSRRMYRVYIDAAAVAAIVTVKTWRRKRGMLFWGPLFEESVVKNLKAVHVVSLAGKITEAPFILCKTCCCSFFSKNNMVQWKTPWFAAFAGDGSDGFATEQESVSGLLWSLRSFIYSCCRMYRIVIESLAALHGPQGNHGEI